MRAWLAIVMAAGCGRLDFDPATGDATDGTGDGASGTPEAFCPQVPELIACFQFENTIVDGSMYANTPTGSGVTYAAGHTGMAVSTDSATTIVMAETPSLDTPGPITIEAWLRPTTLGGARYVLIDHDYGYAVFARMTTVGVAFALMSSGSTSYEPPEMLTLSVWTHLAMTFDGATLKIYVNGTAMGSQPIADTISTAGTNNVRIGGGLPGGEEFIGELDELRIWRSIRTPTELCQAAGAC